jgi:hypothetical protein
MRAQADKPANLLARTSLRDPSPRLERLDDRILHRETAVFTCYIPAAFVANWALLERPTCEERTAAAIEDTVKLRAMSSRTRQMRHRSRLPCSERLKSYVAGAEHDVKCRKEDPGCEQRREHGKYQDFPRHADNRSNPSVNRIHSSSNRGTPTAT